MKIQFELAWHIEIGNQRHAIEPLLFALLEAVERGGHLNYAARATGVSYRHAWGLMRTWEQRLHQPLLILQRGRGAELAAAGRALLAARERAERAVAQPLDDVAAAAAQELGAVLRDSPGAVKVASSSSEQVSALMEVLRERAYETTLDLLGSEGALRRYRRGEVDVAGFHLPLGALGHTVGRSLLKLLDERRDRVFLLELRVLGLMSRRAQPVRALAELGDGRLRLVNRQAGSGTRLAFDGLLGLAGMAPGDIRGYRDEEYTHGAVAATVAGGGADAGFGTAAAAERYALHFVPLVQERFYLVVGRAAGRALTTLIGEFARRALATAARTPAAAELAPTLRQLARLHGGL